MTKLSTLLGIDTVRIALEGSLFRIVDFFRFKKTPRAWVFNPSTEDKQTGHYWPRLSFYKRTEFSATPRLEMEFSLPKMAFGNNVQELMVADKNLLLAELCECLAAIHVETTPEKILAGTLNRVDFGKNLIGCNTTNSLYELQRIMSNKRRVSGQTDYMNGGRSVRFRNASSDLVFYDKMKDPDLSQRMSFETDYYCQTSLLQNLQESGIDVLRMEYRLVKRKDVRQAFKKFGINNPVFEDVFHGNIGKTIINEEWSNILKNRIPSIPTHKSLLEQVIYMLKNNRGGNITNLFSSQLLQLLLKEHTVDEIKNILSRYFSSESIRYFFHKQKQQVYCNSTAIDPFDSITRQIIDWQAVRLPLIFEAKN